jgi:DNA-directed RNA polymerase specialized sigma subunit
MFLSIDERIGDEDDFDSPMYQIEDKSENYNIGILNKYLMGLLKKYLDYKEYEVLRLSYGLNCDRHGANAIAEKLDIQGASAYVRVSEIKKQAVQKLIDNVNPAEVLDYF